MRLAAGLVAVAAAAPAGVPIAHGTWHGVPWTARAERQGSQVCISFSAPPRSLPAHVTTAPNRVCSRFRVRSSGSDSRHWVAFAASRSSNRGPLATPDVVEGVAAAGVAQVRVELRGRRPASARTVPALGRRLFVVLLPKGVDAVAVAAVDRNGTVLERRRVRLDAPHGSAHSAQGLELLSG